MLDKLKKLNTDIEIYSIKDEEFNKYGCVLDFNADEIIAACEKIERPVSGSSYSLSVDELEYLESSHILKEKLFGGCAAQVGLCHGYNSDMNALEYHNSSEINVAATPLVLILGLRTEMADGRISSENLKAFYLEKGDTVEIFGTTLHFCPCQVSDEGFSCVVVLPEGTNGVLETPTSEKMLFKKNKWLICHEDNEALIAKGVSVGIYGKNYYISY